MLDQQRIFPADLGAPRNVVDLHEQGRIVDSDRGHPAIDYALLVVNLGGCKSQFVRILVTRSGNATEDLPHFGFVVHQAQQRPAARARPAYAENVFSRRIEIDDQEVVIEQDDAGV